MGNCLGHPGVPKVDEQELKRSNEIENALSTEKKSKARIKLLLLGPGGSGKSTIAKQMRILFLKGFQEKEREPFKEIIQTNIFQTIRAILLYLQTTDQLSTLSQENREIAELFLSNNESIGFMSEFTLDVARKIKSLWTEEIVKDTFFNNSASLLNCNESADFYLNDLDRISQPNYIPTDSDILRARARTTGVHEIQFQFNNVSFSVIDVGGQRTERRKWIHQFHDVAAVLFCIAMSDYSMNLYEDKRVNRMHESVTLFQEIVNLECFQKTSIILFLNKKDLFEDRIKRIDMKSCFPEYTGGHDAEAGTKFLIEKFNGLVKRQQGLYQHVTTATDTDNIRLVFKDVTDIVLFKNLEANF